MSDKSSAHWLQRAAELRAKARRMKDTLIHLEMEIMARAYERLAAYLAEAHSRRQDAPGRVGGLDRSTGKSER